MKPFFSRPMRLKGHLSNQFSVASLARHFINLPTKRRILPISRRFTHMVRKCRLGLFPCCLSNVSQATHPLANISLHQSVTAFFSAYRIDTIWKRRQITFKGNLSQQKRPPGSPTAECKWVCFGLPWMTSTDRALLPDLVQRHIWTSRIRR